MIFTSLWVSKIVHFKRRPRSGPVTIAHVVEDLRESPTAIDLELEDAKYEGTGWRMLEVRPWWARVAVGCDMVIVAALGLSVTAMFADPAGAAKASAARRIDDAMLVSLVIGLAFFGFSLYAHKKATQPRRPKRAWLPAFLRAET